MMANEKRLIDANVFIRDLTAMKSVYDAIALDGMIKALKEAPTVDAVEVVRCKDCKHWEQTGRLLTYWECNIFGWIHGNGYPTKADDFCSYGERRTNGETETT